MNESTGTGIIPQSTALQEPSIDSLSELLSRDPFGYGRQERDQVVAALREQRLRFEQAERDVANGVRKSVRGATKAPLPSKTAASIEDLDL